MIREIVKDILFLGQKSDEADDSDEQIIKDLKDTLTAHRDGCVGMAANMIGARKRIIIVSLGLSDLVMVNPVIQQRAKPYETEEGCLSFEGVRRTKRFQKIRVQYLDEHFQRQVQSFEGAVA